MRDKVIYWSSGCCFFFFFFFYGLWPALGVSFSLLYLGLFVLRLGNKLPVMELIAVLAWFQWVFGAFIAYRMPPSFDKYRMYVDESTYFKIMVPLCLAFSVGLSFKQNTLDFNQLREHFKENSNFTLIGTKLIYIGLFAMFFGGYLPSSFRFFMFLVQGFAYVGVGILTFINKRQANHYLIVLFALLILNSLRIGMFHDLILWGVFFGLFWFIKKEFTVRGKLIIICFGFFTLSTLQAVKGSYRALIRSGSDENKIALFSSLLFDQIFSEGADETEISDQNVRLNQGWINSAIIKNVPENETFANGETIYEALSSSLLPRFLNPSKKKAGGQENFRRFTGLPLADNTSMGISVAGEAYANFGTIGGVLFMALWGRVLSFVFSFLINKAQFNPVIIFFVPVIFFQVVKAETELVVVLNHLVKASMVVWMFFWGARNILKWEV